MIKNIYKLILTIFILTTPIHFVGAESNETQLEKKHKIYKAISDIRTELNENEHSQEQVAKSHKKLNKVLITLIDDYQSQELQETK